MMWPFISHEIMKFFARVVAAMTEEVKTSIPGALSKCTLFYPIIDIVAETTITVCCSACTAKETTGATFQGFHIRTFFNARVRVAVRRINIAAIISYSFLAPNAPDEGRYSARLDPV
jgi:hypothetical protein